MKRPTAKLEATTNDSTPECQSALAALASHRRDPAPTGAKPHAARSNLHLPPEGK